MSTRSQSTQPLSVSLGTLLTAPSVLLIIITVAAVGYFSFLNGQAAVNDVAQQLRNETALRIKQHLTTFLSIPHQINQLNAAALEGGAIGLNDVSALQRHFGAQINAYPTISSIYVGTPQGGIVGSGREGAAGTLYVEQTENFTAGTFNKYKASINWQTGTLLATAPNFDARTRPWYLSAAQKQGATWSPIYILFTGQDMAIAASQPVYDPQHNLLGVVSVDIFLTQLSQFLETLDLSPTGQIFIMEHSGALVATSTGEDLFIEKNNDGKKERLYASESASVLIRRSAQLLTETYGDFKNLHTSQQQLQFDLAGEKQFVQYLPFHDTYGIDWMVVVAIPESAFMERINTSNRFTLWIILLALATAVGISLFITPRITRRISELDRSARELAAGQWDQELDAETRIAELNSLAVSFNQMKEQLRQTLNNLTTEITDRQQAEAALRESQERYRVLFEQSPDGIVILNPENARPVEFNDRVCEQLGYTRAEFSQISLADIEVNETLEESLAHIQNIIRAGRDDFETRQRTKQGEIRNVHVTAQVIQAGEHTVYHCVWRDITERKRAEAQIRAALVEKEMLLRELNHRTKNNLNIVNALIHIQANMSNNPSFQALANTLENRIQSIALAHQMLYQSANLSQVDLSVYIHELVSHLLAGLAISTSQIEVEIDATPTSVSINAAIPCGQILNELISNAFKYAFPGGRQGKLTIHIHQTPDGEIFLRIADNGIGLPAGFDPLASETLGMTIVRTLAEQIHGHLTMTSDPGFACEVRFKENRPGA